MKIRIIHILPEKMFPLSIAEKLLGCEVVLSAALNPDAAFDAEVYKVEGISERTLTYEVGMVDLLTGIREKYPPSVQKEIIGLLTKECGPAIFAAQISLPRSHCELVCT